MSKFLANVAVDFLNPIDAFTSVTSRLAFSDSRALIFRNEDNTQSAYFGSFTYPSPATIDGVINHLAWLSPEYGTGGAYDTYIGVSDIVLSVSTFMGYLRAGDSIGLREFVFGGNDTFYGSNEGDRILGFNGDDVLWGYAGNDDINGNVGLDFLAGMLGDDNVRGGKDADRVEGNDGNDTVNGNIGNDLVYGGEGSDWVLGGQNEDALYGENGDDLLSGDLGNDTLTGGAGRDSFLFNLNAGSDIIIDFQQGQDVIMVTAALAATVGNSFAAAVTYSGADTLLNAGGVQIRIVNAHVLETDLIIV